LKGKKKKKRIPYFLHVHKAGGTTACYVARVANGLKAPKRNCNLPGDGPRTLGDGPGGTANEGWDCAGRFKAVVAERHLEFFAVERWLDTRLVGSCPHFFFATVVRRPVDRFISHCRFERVAADRAMAWANQGSVPFRLDEPSSVQRGPAVVDNFYLRSFLGRRGFFLPVGALNDTHLLEAAGTLASFDAVLVLERLDTSFRQLYSKLDWCQPRDTKRSWGKGGDSITFSDEQLATFRAINHLDLRFYDFADDLAAALEADVDPAFHPRPCGGGGTR